MRETLKYTDLKKWIGFNTKIYFILFVIFAIVIIGIALINKYMSSESFFEGITVEAFGMLFDIFILGILFSIFYNIGENKRRIRRYLEEIDDFRHWDQKESMYRLVGTIKRLVNLGKNKLPLHDCFLENALLSDINLSGSDLENAFLSKARLDGADLTGANLQGADLKDANFQDAGLSKTNLQNASLEGANLQGTVLNNTDMQTANLRGASLWKSSLREAELQYVDFRDSDLNEMDLTGANLQEADLTNARGLNKEMLLNVKSLYKATGLSAEMEEWLRIKKPELFVEPEEPDEEDEDLDDEDEEQEPEN